MNGSLAGKRILVVEDEYFIASDLRRALQAEQAIVVGPVASLEDGVSLAGCEPIDAAVLDVNLEGTSSYSVADRLGDRRIPYMFLTGYDAWALPEPYRQVPHMPKPYAMPSVLAALGSLLEVEPVR